MKPVIEDWTIVAVGSWNLAILNPEWVGRNVFDVTQLEVEMLIESGRPRMRYASGNVLVIPGLERLIVAPKEPTVQAFEEAERVMLAVLEKLPITPVTAIGINLSYRQAEVERNLAALFSFDDSRDISDEELEIKSSAISREFAFEDRVLNFTIKQETDGKVLLKFNFHKPVPTASDAADAIRNKVAAYIEFSSELVEDVYDLELEQEIQPDGN